MTVQGHSTEEDDDRGGSWSDVEPDIAAPEQVDTEHGEGPVWHQKTQFVGWVHQTSLWHTGSKGQTQGLDGAG